MHLCWAPLTECHVSARLDPLPWEESPWRKACFLRVSTERGTGRDLKDTLLMLSEPKIVRLLVVGGSGQAAASVMLLSVSQSSWLPRSLGGLEPLFLCVAGQPGSGKGTGLPGSIQQEEACPEVRQREQGQAFPSAQNAARCPGHLGKLRLDSKDNAAKVLTDHSGCHGQTRLSVCGGNFLCQWKHSIFRGSPKPGGRTPRELQRLCTTGTIVCFQ